MLNYLGVKRHDVCTLLSNGSAKKSLMCGEIWRVKHVFMRESGNANMAVVDKTSK